MPRSSYKTHQLQQREEDIMRVAARLIGERGYSHVSMDDIAAEVGISKPTLYRHFKSKEEMVTQSLVHGISRIEGYIHNATGSPIERLEQIMRQIFQSSAEAEKHSMMLPREVAIKALHSANQIDEQRHRVNDQLFTLLEEARQQGQIDPTIPDFMIVGVMFSLLSVLDAPAIYGHSDTDIDPIIDQTVRIFLRGIAPR